MNERLRRLAPWFGYPLFYLAVLFLCIRCTFPYERVKDRIVAEFEAAQKQPGKRLEIDELGGHWLFGVKAKGVRLITDPPASASADAPARPKVMELDSLKVSVGIFRRLLGTWAVSYQAELGGGEIDGTFFQNAERAEIDARTEEVGVAGLSVLEDLVELPLDGVLNGSIRFVLPEGKMSQAEGEVDLTISGLAVGDGKAKIRNTIALPRLEAGDLVLKATALEGRLNVQEFNAKGPDFELQSDGNVRLRDPFDGSIADLNVAFKFTEGYMGKSDLTKSLFGEPGSKVPGLFDMDPKIRRAKADDGFYRWKVAGPLARLNFRPAPRAGTNRAATRRSAPTEEAEAPSDAE